MPDPSWAGAPSFHRPHMPYDDNRGWFRGEDDFPGPRTMASAARWLREEAPHHDRFLLVVDEFDPHEPFDTPEPWASRYDPDWDTGRDGPHLVWPPYAVDGVARGELTARQGRQVRAQYGGKLSMIDHWFGRVLDALRDTGRFDDTVVVVCTDHGHYLGEDDLWGKPGTWVRPALGHIPLLVSWPGVAAGTRDALTTTVDLHATMCDLFGVVPAHRTHGRSLRPVVEGTSTSVRDHVLGGVWGREVHLVTDRWRAARAPVDGNRPLSMWSNRWSTMPVHVDVEGMTWLPLPDGRATLDRMPGSTVPVMRQPFRAGDLLPFWGWGDFTGDHLLDRAADPDGTQDLGPDHPDIAGVMEQLRAALQEVDAPEDQFVRLGLA